MALYEYLCRSCKAKFEAIQSHADSKSAPCPKCGSKTSDKLVSRFAVGGRGDLRESTMHGCHDNYTGMSGDCGAGACGTETSSASHEHHD